MLSTIRNLIEARRDKENDEGGFTLIELLIVIVVLGILAAIVVFAVQNLTKDSAATSCNADAKNVETALEAYKAKTGAYPTQAAPAFTTLSLADHGTFVGIDKYIRSAPGTGHYLIGLKSTVAAPGPYVTDGKVYVKSLATGATEAEFNSTATVCATAAT